MGKINRLDTNLMNMIAAGEVVERPSGIVKELVDNAIDAHATQININIKQGGIELISINDNGEGMSFDDSLLAFERHATSKIKEIKDLWQISSLGFRGEALASIAAVSKVTLLTNDGNESSEVKIEYGKLIHHKPSASNQGTKIDVANLFQKMPARFKYLKNPNYEFSLISDVVNKFALAHPEIAFSLTHNDVEILRTSGHNNLQEVIMQVMDREIAKASIKVDTSDNDYEISGYIVQPSITRASKYYMNLFVNGRMIRAYKLNQAIIDGYKEYIPNDRFPIVFLNLKMDPRLVDVNVHPSKWEVKFSKEKQLENLLKNTVINALDEFFRPSNKVKTKEVVEKVKVEVPILEFNYDNQSENYVERKEIEIVDKVEEKSKDYESIINNKVEPISMPTISEKEEIIDEDIKENQLEKEISVSNLKHTIFDELIVLGQLHKAYILAQSPSGLYIIDQHAAQERYHFEEISKAINNHQSQIQNLLVPIQIKVNQKIILHIETINEIIKDISLHLEIFGNDTVVVREIPTWMHYLNEKEFIQDLLDLFIEKDDVNIMELRRHAIATAACHSSIRFNRTLTYEEMQQVIKDLGKCDQPFHCPHGRPTLIEYTLKDLEKDFLRVK